MTADFQTIAALIVVALAATWLLRRSLGKNHKGGCGSGGECGAVSRDVKALQAKLRR